MDTKEAAAEPISRCPYCRKILDSNRESTVCNPCWDMMRRETKEDRDGTYKSPFA